MVIFMLFHMAVKHYIEYLLEEISNNRAIEEQANNENCLVFNRVIDHNNFISFRHFLSIFDFICIV
jgi:hypothetical protein